MPVSVVRRCPLLAFHIFDFSKIVSRIELKLVGCIVTTCKLLESFGSDI